MQHDRMVQLQRSGGEYFSLLPSFLAVASSLLALLVPLVVGMGLGILIAGSRKKMRQEDEEEERRKRGDDDKVTNAVTPMACSFFDDEQETSSTTTTVGEVPGVVAGNSKKGPPLLLPHNNPILQPPLSSQSGSYDTCIRESGLLLEQVPRHVAVIMDGNRRYGREKYNCANRGHVDGSKTLVEFSKWCLAEGVQMVTVYAFSTENWNRCPSEINSLMNLLCTYCDELRLEAQKRRIKVQLLSTDSQRIPTKVALGMQKLVEETKNGDQMVMNICLSYGSRGEIVNACKDIAKDVANGVMSLNDISEASFQRKLLTWNCPDPDLVIRTSGEYRLSNFLLWQIAYSEMFFLNKTWPEVTKEDFLCVIRQYARERKRRFGK